MMMDEVFQLTMGPRDLTPRFEIDIAPNGREITVREYRGDQTVMMSVTREQLRSAIEAKQHTPRPDVPIGPAGEVRRFLDIVFGRDLTDAELSGIIMAAAKPYLDWFWRDA